MKRVYWIAIIFGGLIVAILAAYLLFGLLLIGFDVQSYSSDGVTVADLDYDDVLENAETAGYAVERIGSSGYHPEGIDELDAELGPDYDVFRIIFPYSEEQRIWATIYADEGITVVTVFSDDLRGPFTIDDLPPDEWLVEHLTLIFDMDAATAETYVSDLKEDIETTDPSTPGAHTPSVIVRDPVDFPNTYAYLTERATAVETNSSPGTGWHERVYVANNHTIGQIDFVLSRTEIIHEFEGYRYVVTVDYHGGVRVDAETRAYRSFPEETVRSVFREMFERLGIPPDTIDHIHLEYRGSVW